LCAARKRDGVELVLELLRGNRFPGVARDALRQRRRTDIDGGAELHALGAQLVETPVDDALVELEIRNAKTKQAADAIALLEHGDFVARSRELLRARQAGRA